MFLKIFRLCGQVEVVLPWRTAEEEKKANGRRVRMGREGVATTQGETMGLASSAPISVESCTGQSFRPILPAAFLPLCPSGRIQLGRPCAWPVRSWPVRSCPSVAVQNEDEVVSDVPVIALTVEHVVVDTPHLPSSRSNPPRAHVHEVENGMREAERVLTDDKDAVTESPMQ